MSQQNLIEPEVLCLRDMRPCVTVICFSHHLRHIIARHTGCSVAGTSCGKLASPVGPGSQGRTPAPAWNLEEGSQTSRWNSTILCLLAFISLWCLLPSVMSEPTGALAPLMSSPGVPQESCDPQQHSPCQGEWCGLGLFSTWGRLDDSGRTKHIHPGLPSHQLSHVFYEPRSTTINLPCLEEPPGLLFAPAPGVPARGASFILGRCS